MTAEKLIGRVFGNQILLRTWDDIPGKYHEFLKRWLEDPSRSKHAPPSAFAKWDKNDVIVGSEITPFLTEIEFSDDPVDCFPDRYTGKQKKSVRSYRFPKTFGRGHGFASYPPDAPDQPLRLYVKYKPGSSAISEFACGIQKRHEFGCFLIDQNAYDLLREIDPGIPDDRFFPVIINCRGEKDVAQMYLFDPEVRDDIIDFDHSVLLCRYRGDKSFYEDVWAFQAQVPGYQADKTISIARSGLGGAFFASKDLIFTLMEQGVPGVISRPDATDEFLGRSYTPRNLLGSD